MKERDREGNILKTILCGFAILIVGIGANVGFCEDKVTCTIEKRLTTDKVLEKPMVSKETIILEAKPFGNNYVFSLSPAEAECEVRIPNPNGGSFVNCWTLDKKYGFRSDRTIIDENKKSIPNTLSFADEKKQIVVQIVLTCE